MQSTSAAAQAKPKCLYGSLSLIVYSVYPVLTSRLTCRHALQAATGPQSTSAAAQAEFDRLYGSLADFGDHELVLAGLHENFAAARYLDTHMARTAAILDQLSQVDRLLHRVHRRAEFAALRYVPAHALAVRGIVAGPQRCALLLPLFCSWRKFWKDLWRLLKPC